MSNLRIDIDEETLQDLINIETGLLVPLRGFMCEDDYVSVVNDIVLHDNKTVWTIPVTLDVDGQIFRASKIGNVACLYHKNNHCANIVIESKYCVAREDLEKVFMTFDESHPGVLKELRRNKYRIGGRTTVIKHDILEGSLKPAETKAYFLNSGWKTIAGFQTRNPIHNAHEHLQRIALDLCDAIFINPITGWKKIGDFTEEAVITAYRKMIDEFYPKERIYFAGLKTQMRYAGPREAIFHAIIRKNLGCTHFIIGRDHAGVGGFYGSYDAHELAKKLIEQYDLGITLLLFHEPYYCTKCGFVVSNKTCCHEKTHRIEISGTRIREYMKNGKIPESILMRPEISRELLKLENIFIEE